jgi:hypothetical protein
MAGRSLTDCRNRSRRLLHIGYIVPSMVAPRLRQGVGRPDGLPRIRGTVRGSSTMTICRLVAKLMAAVR